VSTVEGATIPGRQRVARDLPIGQYLRDTSSLSI
jgi:hypothetical protein